MQELLALPKFETSQSQAVDPSRIWPTPPRGSTASLAAIPRLDFGVSPNFASRLRE